MRHIWVLLSIGFSLTVAAQSSFENSVVQIRSKMDSLVRSDDIVGASIAVGKGDSILFSEGFGLADKDRNTVVRPYHKFRIYSLSKQVTALAVAVLAEQGHLHLDSSIGTYIPLLSSQLKPITVRQLIGHTSGIRSYAEGEWQDFANGPCISPFEALLIFESDSLLFEPGDQFKYTTYGYVLLSAVIEKVSGMPFLQFLEASLFKPVGLVSFSLDNADAPDTLAVKPYEYWKEVMYDARYANNTCKYGGGGLLASPSEVVLLNLELLNGTIVSEFSRAMLFTSIKLNDGTDTGYGFGMEFATDKEGRFYAWHSGRSRGGRNALILYPDSKLVVCISANTNGESLVPLVQEIASFFLE
jgi:CubicO group peptidase (beta-lactamase class C family)